MDKCYLFILKNVKSILTLDALVFKYFLSLIYFSKEKHSFIVLPKVEVSHRCFSDRIPFQGIFCPSAEQAFAAKISKAGSS